MLYCLLVQYSPSGLRAMRERRDTDRQAAVKHFLSASGCKLEAMYATSYDGPGVMTLFDAPDAETAEALSHVVMESDTLRNPHVFRLFSPQEITAIREKARELFAGYQPPGKA